MLLDKGAHTEDCDVIGLTALHLAAKYGHSGIIQLLVDRGASLEARNMYEWTPLCFAVLCSQIGATELLLNLGSESDLPADDGTTLLDSVGCYPSWPEDTERDARVREVLRRAGCTEETGRKPFLEFQVVSNSVWESLRAMTS